MTEQPPLIVVLAVGLTGRILPHAPRLSRLALQGWSRPLGEVHPSVTCSAQATILTGKSPQEHGVVGNGWLFRDTGEVRFWQQSNALMQAEPIYKTLKREAKARGRSFTTAKLFWWFNQGAAVDISVTPKPYYGADGSKAFGIYGSPDGMTDRLEERIGKFPFHTFWGPMAGLPCTQWIAASAAEIVRDHGPDLTLVYLPHLDYDPQRFGITESAHTGEGRKPRSSDMTKLVKELDDACEPLLAAAQRTGARVWVVSEYGHCDVRRAVEPNRILRREGLLTARPGPFGETLDTFGSRAFAVCDHQLAHVHVNDPDDIPRVRDVLAAQKGVGRVLAGEERREIGLDHPRSGELVALSEPDAWFAYPFWLDDDFAPDYARTVDIHRKPGYDPCELFFDPNLTWGRGRAIGRVVQKKLGFRALVDVIPLDATLVRGSHGLPAAREEDRPVLIGDGPAPSPGTRPMTEVYDLMRSALLPD